jgi:1-acyl-sn-glycerol-3-phosphate acyltransferase
MIKAAHRWWARTIFNPYVDRLLRQNFSNFYRVNEYPTIPDDCGLVITPNHISWWDGFFIYYACRKFLRRRGHILMLESQLRRYWFFQKLGAYSINPKGPKSIAETARYTRELLSDLENFVVMYPQGDIEPYEKRPLALKKGLHLFIDTKATKVLVLFVGFKIQYYNQKNPALIVRFGDCLAAQSVVQDFTVFENKFYENLDLLSQAAFTGTFAGDIF